MNSAITSWFLKLLPFLIALVIISAQHLAIQKLEDTKLRLSNKVAVLEITLEQNNQAAIATINEQNAKIEAYKLDMKAADEKYRKLSAELRAQTDNRKVEIVKELAKDPSCENELRLIEAELDGLYE